MPAPLVIDMAQDWLMERAESRNEKAVEQYNSWAEHLYDPPLLQLTDEIPVREAFVRSSVTAITKLEVVARAQLGLDGAQLAEAAPEGWSDAELLAEMIAAAKA